MVFGLIRKSDDANFQIFEDSGICSFQEERNGSLLGSTIGSDGNNGMRHSSSRHICDLLGGLLGDDQFEQDLDEDLLGGSLKNDLTARTRQNLLRAPSLKVQSPPCQVDNNCSNSEGTTSTVRNREFLRAPSMDRDNEYVGIVEESNSESCESSNDTDYGNVAAPVQFELPLETSLLAHDSSRKSLDCLESPEDQVTLSVNDCNVSITFTTCFDLDDDIDNNKCAGPTTNGDLIDLSELEANQIIDEETVRRIREHLQQKRARKSTEQFSKENEVEKVKNQKSNRVRKHRSLSHSGKRASSNSEGGQSVTVSPSRRTGRKKSPRLSPDQSRSKELRGSDDVRSKRNHRKSEGSDTIIWSRRGSRKEDENHRVENRKTNHLSSELRSGTEESERRKSKDDDLATFKGSPSRNDQTKAQKEDLANIDVEKDLQPNIDISSQAKVSEDNADEKKRKSLLGSPGKMVMKFLSQRNFTENKERPTFRRSESQTDIVHESVLSDVVETKASSRSHGLFVESADAASHNENIDEIATLDYSNRSSPRSSTNFASWIRQGRRPSITISSPDTDIHLTENNLDLCNRSSRRQSSSKVADFNGLETSKGATKFDDHFLQSHLINDNREHLSQSKIRPAITRTSSLDVLYSPVRSAASQETRKCSDDFKASAGEETECISSLKRSKPAGKRSISVGAKTDDDRMVQNDSESTKSSNEKVSSQPNREQSISPTKRSVLSSASKQKRDLSQTQHPQSRQLSATSTRTSKTRDLSNSCHVLHSENVHRNESPSQRSPDFRLLAKKTEISDTPSRRRWALTHKKDISVSVHVSPTKRKSGTSTVVTRRLSALASMPVVDPPLHSTKDALTSNLGSSASSSDNNLVTVSESYVRVGKGRIAVVTSDQDSTKAKTDSTIDLLQQRTMSDTVHLSPSKRKNGLNVGASRRAQAACESTASSKGKISPDTVLSPDLTYSSIAIKTANGSIQASTRTRKATVEDLKKDFDHPGEAEVEGSGSKSQPKTNTRKINIFSTRKAS
jgi:hypothetical protein